MKGLLRLRVFLLLWFCCDGWLLVVSYLESFALIFFGSHLENRPFRELRSHIYGGGFAALRGFGEIVL